MNNKEYSKYVDAKAPKSTILKDCVLAFLIGGGICLVAQCINELIKAAGISEKPAGTMLTVIMIAIGAFLTGLGWYSKLGKHAGAGSIVPITGFANSIVSPAMENKSDGLILGLAAKMFTVAGPVIVYGTLTSIAVGIIYYLIYFIS